MCHVCFQMEELMNIHLEEGVSGVVWLVDSSQVKVYNVIK